MISNELLASVLATQEDVIDRKYRRLKAASPPLDLGAPVGPRLVAPDLGQRQQVYERGAIVWARGVGAHEIHGAIWARFKETADLKSLWWQFPLTDEAPTGNDRAGRFNVIGSRNPDGKTVSQHSWIYWGGPKIEAWWTFESSPISQRWFSLDANVGLLGYPRGPERSIGPSWEVTRTQDFERGAIFSYIPNSYPGQSLIPAGRKYISALYGRIWAKLLQLGGSYALGAPFTDVSVSSDQTGIYCHFQATERTLGNRPLLSSIFYHPRVASGPHVVMGAIRDAWIALGAEVAGGGLGYPTSDEQPWGTTGRVSHFERGSIYWSTSGIRVARNQPSSSVPTGPGPVPFELRVAEAVKTWPWWGVVPYEGAWPAGRIPTGDIVSVRVPSSSTWAVWVVKAGKTWQDALADRNAADRVGPGELVPNLSSHLRTSREIYLLAALEDLSEGRVALPDPMTLELQLTA